MENGWVKIHRKIMDKGYYKKSQYIHLWLHLLLAANHNPKEFMCNGKIIIINSGQLITGRKSLSLDTGIPPSTVQDILDFLEKDGELQQQKTTKYRLITILNWKKYQKSDIKPTSKNDLFSEKSKKPDIKKQEKYVDNKGLNDDFKNESDIKPTSSRHQADTNKNDKNVRNICVSSLEENTGNSSSKKPSYGKAINYIINYFVSSCKKKINLEPITNKKEYIIVASLLKKGLKPDFLTDVIDWWFSTQTDKSRLVHLSYCFSTYNINNYKAQNGK